MTRTLVALRLSPDKASFYEFATPESARAFLREFQARCGHYPYAITTTGPKGGRRNPEKQLSLQLRLAV